jgi:hypothetical protein
MSSSSAMNQGITIDWDQLFADLRAVIATSGLPLAKAFESLPVGKYMKLEVQPTPASPPCQCGQPPFIDGRYCDRCEELIAGEKPSAGRGRE